MSNMIRHLTQQLSLGFTVGLLLLIAAPAQATPTIVDSISADQLTGIASNNISSLYADHGTLWITDKHNIAYQWRNGEAPSVFQKGNEKQKFSSLIPISDQRFVLTDTRNAHFLVSTKDSWNVFSEEGDQEGQIDNPIAAAWSKHGIIYIADAGNDRISAFTPEGLFLFTFGDDATGASEDLNLKHITHIAVDRKGRVYVLDETGGGRISIYSALGELDTILGKDEFKLFEHNNAKLTAMTVRPDGVLIVAEKKSGHILEIDWENMKVLSSFGTNGKGRGQFQRVGSLALDVDGKLYVADQGNKKIEIFQLDWQDTGYLSLEQDHMSILPSSVLLSACEKSYIYGAEQILCLNTKNDSVSIRSHDGVVLQQLNSKFNDPVQATFDQNELLILDDKGVKVFDKSGKFKFAFGSKGRRDGDLSDASSLTVTQNAVFIADTGNKRIQVFSRNGLFKQSIGNTKGDSVTLKEPMAVAVGSNGDVYVADAELRKILVYSNKGKLLTQLGYPAEHRHEFLIIHDIMTSQGNMLYAMVSTANNPLSVWVYHNNQYIYRFSPSSQQAQAGYDKQWATSNTKLQANSVPQLKTLAKQALQSTVSINLDLSAEPALSLFKASGSLFGNGNNWIFNPIPSKPNVITILDTANHARHTFIALFPPKKVRNISITGDEKQAHLQWLAANNHFTGYYNIYGRKDISSPFQMVQQSVQPEITLDREKFPFTEYRISASTALGKNSALSTIYQDIFWLGYKAFQSQDYEHALDLLSEATLTNPKHAQAWLYLGKTQMALHNFDEASFTFKKLGQFASWQQQSIYLQAEALMQKEAWLDVKSLVDTAEANGNIDAYLYSLSAHALMQLDDVPSAIYYLSQAVNLEPTSPTWHLALADANFKLGAEKDAKSELLLATQLAGNNINSWLEIARTYTKYQMYDDAIVAYERALSLDAKHQQALAELAKLHLIKGNLADARTLATRMSGISELKGTSYYVLGQVALAEGKAPLALAMLAKAGQTDPNNANIWLSMANAYAKLNQPARETEFLIKANAVDDNNFDVHMRLASSCEAKKDLSCAYDHYKRAAAIDKSNITAQLKLARAAIAIGNMVEADKHAQEALKVNPSSVDAHLVLAEVQSARGMIPASISTLKKAMKIEDDNMDVYLALSKAYIDNHMYDEAIAITDKAMLLDVRNPAPLILSGNIYLARQSFDLAISAFEKAVNLAPDNAKYRLQLNTAYLQKKRSADAGGNAVGLKLNTPQFARVFSAAYKQYTDVPVATLKINNASGVDYTNIKISFFVKEYMDFPTTTVVERVPAGGEVEVPLLAAFNNRILSIDEDTGVQSEVRAEYYLSGKPHVDTRHETMTIYGKNAITWDKLDMVGSFATPKDDVLAVFVRQLVNTYAPKGGAVNPRVAKAMTVYNGLSAYGIKYLVDPNTPYGKLGANQLDTVQFPRETLRQRSGDCDDLSILLVAALSNLGIETAILDVPQHLLMMFNTGVPASRSGSISLNDNALAIINDQVWIPLEATLIASSFNEAWAEGAKKYHLYGKQGKMKIMPLAKAWESYPPVTLPPANFALTIPEPSIVGDKIQKEWAILAVKALERQVRPYRIMLALDARNTQAQMQIAVVYARNGLYEQAVQELKSIRQKEPNNVAALNNLGNIYYMQQNYQKALPMYQQASEAAPNNADIKVNIAMLYYKMGDALKAKLIFDEATAIDDQVPKRYEQLAFLLHQ